MIKYWVTPGVKCQTKSGSKYFCVFVHKFVKNFGGKFRTHLEMMFYTESYIKFYNQIWEI